MRHYARSAGVDAERWQNVHTGRMVWPDVLSARMHDDPIRQPKLLGIAVTPDAPKCCPSPVGLQKDVMVDH